MSNSNNAYNGNNNSTDQIDKEQKSKVIVCVRLRPIIPDDHKNANITRSAPEICVNLRGDGQSVKIYRDQYYSRVYKADHTFAANCSQTEVYRLSFKPVVNDVIRGYNGTGLAYGQTGSGKSYTMFGSDNTPGLAHLALIDIFDSIGGKNRDALDSGNDNSPQKFSYIGSNNNSLNNSRHSSPIAARKGPIDTFSVNSGMDNASSIASPMMSTLGNDSNRLKAKVFIAFYQIYIEQVYDLLGPNSGTVEPLTIREDPKLGVYIENLTYTHIHDKEEAYNVITNGLRNRTVRSTKQNMKSSRSHAILQIFVDVETDSSTDGNHNMMNNNNDYIGNNNDLIDYTFRRSILTLVDLAGSERVKQVKTSTKHFKEAVQINKSISALGTCIQALAVMSADNETFSGFNMNLNVNNNIRSKASRHIPFRDSKLTRILAEPLGGNSKTCIITNISPCAFNYDETVSTLKFASRAKVIKKSVQKEKVHKVFLSPEGVPLSPEQLRLVEEEEEAAANTLEEATITSNEPVMWHHAIVKKSQLPGGKLDEESPGANSLPYSMKKSPRGGICLPYMETTIAEKYDRNNCGRTFSLNEFLQACNHSQEPKSPVGSTGSRFVNKYKNPYDNDSIMQERYGNRRAQLYYADDISIHSSPPKDLGEFFENRRFNNSNFNNYYHDGLHDEQKFVYSVVESPSKIPVNNFGDYLRKHRLEISPVQREEMSQSVVDHVPKKRPIEALKSLPASELLNGNFPTVSPAYKRYLAEKKLNVFKNSNPTADSELLSDFDNYDDDTEKTGSEVTRPHSLNTDYLPVSMAAYRSIQNGTMFYAGQDYLESKDMRSERSQSNPTPGLQPRNGSELRLIGSQFKTPIGVATDYSPLKTNLKNNTAKKQSLYVKTDEDLLDRLSRNSYINTSRRLQMIDRKVENDENSNLDFTSIRATRSLDSLSTYKTNPDSLNLRSYSQKRSMTPTNLSRYKEFQDFKVPGRIVLDIKTGGSIAELLSPQSTIEKSRASNRATSAPVKRLVPTAPPAQSSSTESNDSFTDSQILPDDEAGSKQDIEQNEKDSGQNGENKSDIIAASDRSPDCEPKQIESSDSVASAANDLFPVAVKISAHNSDNLKPLDYLENSTQAKAVDKDIANEQNSVGAEIEPTELTPTVVTASFERGNVLNSNQLKPLTSQLASPEERQRGRMTRGMSFSEELKEVAWTRSKFLQENEIMESAYATDESYTNTPSESRHASPIRAKNAIIESADSNDDREVPSPATYVPCSDDADFKVLYGAEGNTVNSRIFSVPSTETETSGKSGDNSSISGDVFQDKLEEMFNYMELQNVQLDNLRADVHRAVEVKKQKKILDQQELNSNLVSQSVNEDSSPSLPVSTQYPFHLLSSIPEGNIVESFDDNDGDYVYDYNMKTFRRSNSADVSIDNLPAISFSVDSLHSRDEMVYHPSHSGNHSVDAWLFNEKKDLLPSALPSESNVSADEIDAPQSVKEIPEFIAKAVVQETVSNTTSAEVSRLETKEESTSSTPELTTFSSKKDLLEGLMKDPASIRRRSDPNMKASLTPWKDDPEYIVKQQEKSILEPPIETKLPSTNTSNAIKSAPAQESRKMSVDLQALIKQSSLKHKEPDEPTTIQNIVKEDQPNSTLSEISIDKNIEEAPLNADGKVKNEEIDNNGEDEMNSEWFTSPNDVGNGKERRKSNGEKRRLSFDDFVMELKFKANKERTSSLASYRHSKLVEIVLQLEAEITKKNDEISSLKQLIMEL